MKVIEFNEIPVLERKVLALEQWFKEHDESHQYWNENKKSHSEYLQRMESLKNENK